MLVSSPLNPRKVAVLELWIKEAEDGGVEHERKGIKQMRGIDETGELCGCGYVEFTEEVLKTARADNVGGVDGGEPDQSVAAEAPVELVGYGCARRAQRHGFEIESGEAGMGKDGERNGWGI